MEATLLTNDPDAWGQVVNAADLWGLEKRPKQSQDQAKALEWVVRAVHPPIHDPTGRKKGDLNRRQRSRDLAALKELKARGVADDEIAQALEENGGYVKLAADYARRKKGEAEPRPRRPAVKWSNAILDALGDLAEGTKNIIVLADIVAVDQGRIHLQVVEVSAGIGADRAG